MRKHLLFFGISLLLIFSAYSQKSEALKKAKGERYYGGMLKLNETEYYGSLFPPSAADHVSRRLIPFFYEGLLEYDTESLTLKPSLAISWDTSGDGKTYTFHLVKNAYFHNDRCFPSGKGRLLTAADVEKTLYFLCSADALNKNSFLLSGLIKGAKNFYEGKSGHIEGLQVIDPSTIRIQLERPSADFLYLLADPATYIFPEEILQAYGKADLKHKAVGTGPFIQEKNEESNALFLKRNAGYYRKDEFGNLLPYLGRVKVSFITDKNLELEELKKGNLDFIYRLPPDYAAEIIDEIYYPDPESEFRKFHIAKVPELSTYCIVFNFGSYPYSNLAFRRAIGHGVFSDELFEYILHGEGNEVAPHGVIPYYFSKSGYEASRIKPFYFDTDSARLCLKRSGFRKNPDTLVLKTFSDGTRNQKVAEGIKQQLKERLNLDVEVKVLPLAELTEEAAKSSDGMYLLPVMARYPRPSAFLAAFYSKNIPSDPEKPSYLNYSRYANPLFDRYYEAYLNSGNEEEGMRQLEAAEQVLIRDGAVSPVWEDAGFFLLSKRLKGFYGNAIGYRNFRSVYFIK